MDDEVQKFTLQRLFEKRILVEYSVSARLKKSCSLRKFVLFRRD